MSTCRTNKKMYLTMELAEDALIDARIKFEYTKGHGPIAVYRCDECGQYHLTSQGTINEKLARHIQEGKIDLQKEANRWMEKFKKR